MTYLKAAPFMIVMAMMAGTTTVSAQEAPQATTLITEQAADSPWLKVYFSSGSATIAPDQAATLDRAVRTFREGDPFVMIVAGSADKVGDPSTNLELSLRRASVVAAALTNRGIPIDRLQVLGRGTSELKVATGDGVPEEENRVVEISWR
ncbi:OmpA family protein [Yoonia sp.]|jgi:outer membrane protein OmpA-like peptidoglycan-associated protein|uniref:OmpA family protein n=1 Tax=Yoonia sp. TaxID=2212373 RepID=UPI0025EA5A32|nr:OmpA family protein [Yoonia sp.]